MIRWWRGRTTQEKWMVALIAMLAIAVLTRFEFFWKEASDAFSSLFNR